MLAMTKSAIVSSASRVPAPESTPTRHATESDSRCSPTGYRSVGTASRLSFRLCRTSRFG